MGCDIHLYTESLRTVNDSPVWSNCDNWKLNRYFEDDPNESKYNVNPVYDCRDYNLFALLADVRNRHEEKFICDPRGLPVNVSQVVKNESDHWDCDGHSHSHFTLTELKAFRAKNNITKYAGLMTPEQAEKVDAGEMPLMWCQASNVEGYVYREWERAESPLDYLIEKLDLLMRDEFWLHNNEDHPELEEKIRIVFWFDN